MRSYWARLFGLGRWLLASWTVCAKSLLLQFLAPYNIFQILLREKDAVILNWNQLLCTKRVKELYGEKPAKLIEGDLRNPFDQDYGRTVFSTPVRRLQDKAQVFPLERHDAVRTRLTHSMEVSSVARSLGNTTEQFLFEEGELRNESQRGVLGTITATVGLIHDLGNPPFGHAGEAAIGDWFKNQHVKNPKFFEAFTPGSASVKPEETQFALDFVKFEGNAQTQRLLSRLQVLADKYGLDLTCGTLSASCKYVAQSDTVDKTRQERKKHGYFASENELISRIRREVGTGEFRNPLAFLVEASDDIVYSTVDLEDGVKKGVVTWDFVEDELKKTLKADECLERALEKAHAKIDPAQLPGKAHGEAMAVAFRTFAIAEMVVKTFGAFKTRYAEIMSGDYHQEILYESDAGRLAKACKKLGVDYVYVSNETLKLELMGRKIIKDLLDTYWEAARLYQPGKKLAGFAGKIYELISPNYRQIFEENMAAANELNIPEDYFRMQLITDQLSGMTDSYASSMHRELMNVS